MKRILLTSFVVGAAFWSQSQVIFRVNDPAIIQGNYDFTWADPAGGDWATPDFNVPNTFVEDEVAIFGQGTADTLGCTALPAGTFTGQIALIYRGGCEFGLKALNAQNAGAVATIIVNNAAGAPIEMGGGASGLSVTTPVAMVSQADGALIRNQLNLGNYTEVFIGNKSGQFANDLGFYSGDLLISPYSSVPILTADNAADFSVQIGGTVFNYGSDPQPGVTVTASVTLNGAPLYFETTSPALIASGDSLAFTLPDFSLPAYAPGRYKLTYTASSPLVSEEFLEDNVFTSEFRIDDKLISYASYDTITNAPLGSNGYRISGATGEQSTCIVYMDESADELAVDGLWISALMGNTATAVGDSLYGEEVFISILEWNNVFTDLNDPNLAIDNLNQIAQAVYTYPSGPVAGAFQGQAVYAPFDSQIPLQANQRYLFCESTFNDNVFFTFDSENDYSANENAYLQPYYALGDNGTYSLGFTNVQTAPSMAVSTFPVTELAIAENTMVDASAYPNPTTSKVTISVKSEGNGIIHVTDLNGRVVLNSAVVLNGGIANVDLSTVDAGMYIFNVVMQNGDTAQFNVVKK